MGTANASEKKVLDWLRHHHGVIGRREALQLGAGDAFIRAKVLVGEWEELYRGVYRDAASQKTPHQMLRAACVYTTPVGVVSHRSAAWLWGLTDRAPDDPELTVPALHHHGETTKGIVVHRSKDLDLTSHREWQTIRVTTPLRTLVDFAGCVTANQLADAVDRALAKGLVSIPRLLGELNRLGRRGRPGAGLLRRLLRQRGYIGVPSPSVLESKTQRLFSRYHLPVPESELTTGEDGEYRLDFAYVDIRLAIEVDGYVWHFSPEHKRRDEARRNALVLQGWQILVYTWRDVTEDPARVAAEIAAMYHAAA